MTVAEQHPRGHVRSLEQTDAVEMQPATIWTYLAVLLRHRVALVMLPLALAAVAFIGAVTSRRLYVASASFAPEEAGTGGSLLGQLAAQFGVGSPAASAGSPQFYADLLKTREILKGVVGTQYEVAAPMPFRGTLIEFYSSRGGPQERMRAATRSLAAATKVRTDRATNVVSIEVQMRNPGLSLAVVNRFIDLVNGYNAERRRQKARADLEFVEEQLVHAERVLNASEDALADFYRRNRQIANSPDLRAEEARLQRRVAQRQQVYLSLAQGREASRIEAARSSPFITVIERPEGFVEPASRGTVRRTMLGFLVGLFAAVLYAFVVEYLRASRRSATRQYQEFSSLVGDTVRGVRGALASHRRASP